MSGEKQVSFESYRLKGRISTLLMLLLPIIVGATSVSLSLLGFSPSTNPYVSALFLIPSYTAYILFLWAMNGLAKYYGDSRIFKNSLYVFIVSSTVGITSLIVMYTFFPPILDQLSADIARQGDIPSLSVLTPLLQMFVFIWVVLSVIGILNGFFYRGAFYALAASSGEHNFKQAGLFMFIGGILMIAIVGALLFFIGLIFAVLGFFSMKPTGSQIDAAHENPPH